MKPAARENDPFEDFRREVVDVNVRRIPWLLIASMLLALWPIAMMWQDESVGWLRRALMVDAVSAGLFIALGFWLRRLPSGSPWRSLYVWAAVVLLLAYMDGYYFLVGQSFGQNPVYILGVITAATIFLLPPPQFLALLFVNHLVYCALLKTLAAPGTDLLVVFIQNTTGATVAALVSILLYRAHREAFFQRRALASANRALARRNDQLNDLMAITAHDLRGPLLGMRDLLGLAGRAPATARLGETLEHVERSCGDLISLVNRLLDVHAAEARAEKPAVLVRCDLRDLVAAAVGRVRPGAEARGVALDVRMPDGPAEAAVDPPALGQVLDNLLANAIKFSPPGGAVQVGLAREEGRWRCDVADDGPGIPEPERVSLFQKFHRGGHPRTAGETSGGLGLFIAATLMGAMGGRVDYVPRQPAGSLFRITFGESREAGAG
jgi:signal transduction histidine kinase